MLHRGRRDYILPLSSCRGDHEPIHGKERAELSMEWPARTHGLNFYTRDRNLQRFLERSAPEMMARQGAALEHLGAFCGGDLDEQAAWSDRIHPPVFRQEVTDLVHPGERRGRVYLNSHYEEAQQELYRRGFLSRCFDPVAREPQILPFAAQYLVCKSDIATGCPFAMTHPVALLIDRHASPAVRTRFLPELLRTDGRTAVGGTWATERHSGSDIANTTTKALDQGEGTVRLHGENWFASAIGFSRFLALKTARPEGAPPGAKGLGLYLVPSHVDPDWRAANEYEITQLKEKVGTRGLPTGEIRLSGTLAWELAPAGAGLKMMMEALTCSRVHNAMAAAGVMHRALMEALCWCMHRSPFGRTLVEQPMVRKRLLDLQTEWLSGSALAFEAARSFDAGRQPWARIATSLAKYKTAEQAVWCARKAMELVGGNGYTEEYPVARLFRDAHVLTVWEGPEQIQALDLMRMMIQEDGGQVYLDRLSAIAAACDGMEAHRGRLEALIAAIRPALDDLTQNPALSSRMAGEYLERMAEILAYALMCEEGAWEMAHCNDAEKALFAERFHARTFIRNIRPDPEMRLLEKEFSRVAAGRGFEPSELR